MFSAKNRIASGLEIGDASLKKALIVKFGEIGDVIMAIPAARALYEEGFAIDWLCGKSVLPLLECYSWITPVPADDKVILQGSSLLRAQAVFSLWRKVALRRYDLCVSLYYDRRYRLLTLPIRAQRKLMLSRASRATTLLNNRHHTDEYIRVLLNLEDGCREQSNAPVRPDRLPSPSWPFTLRKDPSAPPRVALVPGAANNLVRHRILGHSPEGLRRWPIENYVALARTLLSRGWEVVLLGGPNEFWVRPYFVGLKVTDFLGALSLPEVVSACNVCDAVISNDTGPLHLAGLSDTCLLGIFGPTDPATRIPRRPYSVGLWGGQGFACRPCYDGTDFAPCHSNGCMRQVTPEIVIRELDRLLDERLKGLPSPWRIAFPYGNSTAV